MRVMAILDRILFDLNETFLIWTVIHKLTLMHRKTFLLILQNIIFIDDVIMKMLTQTDQGHLTRVPFKRSKALMLCERVSGLMCTFPWHSSVYIRITSNIHTYVRPANLHPAERLSLIHQSLLNHLRPESHPLKPKPNHITLSLNLLPNVTHSLAHHFFPLSVLLFAVQWYKRVISRVAEGGPRFTFKSCISIIPERAHGSIPPLWQAAISRPDHMTWQ